MASKKITRQLSIFINGKEVKNSLGGIGREIGRVKALLKEANDPKDIKKYKAELDKLGKAYTKVKKELGYLPSLFSKIKKEFGLLGLTIASIFSIDAMLSYFQTLKEKVEVLKELKHTIAQITELEGKELDIVTAKVKALADSFDDDATKMTQAANNLSKQMAIDFDEALNLIEKGYLDGANANGDFLDKLAEYPALLKEAGLSAKQSIALMSQEVKKGIYSDKGVDAIKEANLRLREMPKSTIEALDAIGLSSKTIQEELATGAITTFEAVQKVSKRLDALPAQSSVVGKAIADIFGGPGEDAGLQYLATLHEIDLSLNDVTTATDDYTKAKKLELQANESLNNIWVQLTGTASSLNLVWAKMKLQLAKTLNFLAKLVGLSEDADGSMLELREKIVTVTKVLLIGVTAFFSYNAALRLMALWTKAATGDTVLNTLAIKANAAGKVIAKAATLAYVSAVALLTGNTKKATVAMRAFSIATKLNPIGLLVAAITTAIAAYQLFSKTTDAATIKQQALNEVKKKSAVIFGKEEAELKKLLAVAKNENLSKEERIKAIHKLNELSPRYLGNLTLENINTTASAEAIEEHVKAMKKRAEQKALEQLIDETIKKRREEEAKDLDEHIKWYDYLSAAISGYGNSTLISMEISQKAVDRRKENIDELDVKEKLYLEEYKANLEEQAKADENLVENDKKFKRIRASLENTAFKLKIKNIEKLSNEQLRVEIQKAIERNNQLAAINQEKQKQEEEELQRKLEKEQETIKQAKEKLAEFLDQWEADRALQKELEKYDEEQRAEEEEILKLEAKLAKMEEEAGIIGLKEEELSEADRELKERLEEAKEQGISAIRKKYADKRQKEQEKADKEHFKKLKTHHKKLAKADLELEEAKGNALRFGVETLKGVFGERTAIYKVLFAFEKAMAIGEIITNTSKSIAEIGTATAIANAKAVAASPLTSGMPWVAQNTALAAKQTLAAKINAGVQIASIAASAIKGFKDGGHTGDKAIYNDNYGKVVGVVHDEEWVAPKFMTQNPVYAPTIQWLENQRLKELGKGFIDGGNTTETTTPQITEDTPPTTQDDAMVVAVMQVLQKLDSKLDEGFKGYVVRDYEDYLNRKEIDADHDQIYKNTRA